MFLYPDFLNLSKDVTICLLQAAVAALITGFNFKKTTGVSEGKVSKVKLKCTWDCGRRSSQQGPVCVRRTTSSRAEHSKLWGEASSPHRSETKTWYPRSSIQSSTSQKGSWLLSFLSFLSTSSQREHNESQYLSFCLPSTLPSFPSSLSLSCESSCGSNAVREVEAPEFPLPISWGSQSHFRLFSQTQSILTMVEH